MMRPKIAIIFIGTFFQQVLIISNTVRRVDPALVEAVANARRVGAGGCCGASSFPAAVTDIYTDMRILLGWAWTYLIVAEVVGTMSGITYFINQQARYRNFPNVYAAIAMIGIIGLSADLILAWLGTRFFPWKRTRARGCESSCLPIHRIYVARAVPPPWSHDPGGRKAFGHDHTFNARHRSPFLYGTCSPTTANKTPEVATRFARIYADAR